MEKQKKVRNARWGAACMPCATAKARCIRSKTPRARCDRCQSLDKTCSDRISGPRKKRQAKNPKISRPIEAPNKPTISPGTSEEVLSQNAHDGLPSLNQGDPSPSTGAQTQASIRPRQEEVAPRAPVLGLSYGARPACTCSAIVSEEDLSLLESDEILLAIYVNQLSTRFPFVVIPAGTTPRQLQAERPFLMKVITMVASVRNLPAMKGQSHALMRYISDAMLVRSERSLDLLQGIVVFLGFYHYHCMAHAQFSNLINLAVSLVEDMTLSTYHLPHDRKLVLPLLHPRDPRPRSNEERRALLGVWYMRSNASLFVKQLGSVNYTKDLNQCLVDLEKAAEYETDQLAVQLIRFQNLTNKLFHFHNRDQLLDELPGTSKASSTECLEAFQVQLDRLWNSLTPKLKSNYLISSHYHDAYLQLLEPLLADTHLPGVVSQGFESLSLSSLFKVNIFSHFTTALKNWFDNWLSLPVCSYFYMPQPATFQLLHACRLLVHWARTAGPSAVRPPTSGIDTKRMKMASQPLPAFSGLPECPDLGVLLPPTPASVVTSSITGSTQPLDSLEAQVLEHCALRIDIFGILDTMAARFEAARKEMAAAQGGLWNNDIWDVAAVHLRLKRYKIEKWCDIAAMMAGEERNRLADGFNETSGEIRDILGELSLDGLDWFNSDDSQQNGQWGTSLFDDIMNADIGAVPDVLW